LSDSRLKHSITGLEDALEKIREIQAISFKYNEQGIDIVQLMNGKADDDINTEKLGFMAEEIEAVFPELIELVEVEDTKYRAVDYIGMIPVLLEAIKDLDKKVCDLDPNTKDDDNTTTEE